MSPSDERLWSLLAHISVPFLGFVGPLIIWLVYKDRSRLVTANAVEALNFSILYSIVLVVGSILTFLFVGVVLIAAALIVALVFAILGAIAANKGEAYRYPVNLRLVK